MPSRKVLKSVAHSVAESFASLMNYWGDDYVMGHIVKASWQTGATTLNIDLLSTTLPDSRLLVDPVRQSVTRYMEWFPQLVSSSGSTMAIVRQAKLTISVTPTSRRPTRAGSNLFESPFVCTATLVDDRGREYSHSISGWWYPETPPSTEPSRIDLSRRLRALVKKDT